MMSETPQQPSSPNDEIIASSLSPEHPEAQPIAATSAPTPVDPAVSAATVEEIANNVDGSATTPVGETTPLEVEAEADATTPADAQSLTTKLKEISNQRDAFQSQYLRIAADFDNFRKRSSKEKEDTELRVKCATIIELLSVVDNFERARTQIKPQNDGEMGIHKSYQGVYKQLVESLKRIGVSPMRPEGQQFDPNLHEAVMRQPTEEHPEGTVIEELQRGYFLGDRILRHSLVKVAAPPEQLSVEDAVDVDN
jgi:molecular chaperone GrpE